MNRYTNQCFAAHLQLITYQLHVDMMCIVASIHAVLRSAMPVKVTTDKEYEVARFKSFGDACLFLSAVQKSGVPYKLYNKGVLVPTGNYTTN